MSEKPSVVRDERDELAQLELKLAQKRNEVEAKENFGKYDYSVPAENEHTYTSYLEERPADGIVREGDSFRNAKSGEFASLKDYESVLESNKDYYDRQYDLDTAGEKTYQDMSLIELAKKLGENEDDRSISGEIIHVLGEKVDAMAEKYGWDDEQKAAHADALFEVAYKAKEASQVDTLDPADPIPADGARPTYVKDENAALAEAYNEYEIREGHEYGARPGYVKDKDAAEGEAIDESKRRVTPDEFEAARAEATIKNEARKDYIDENAALAEAYNEYEIREGHEYGAHPGYVKDKETAHQLALDMQRENRPLRRAYRRLNVAFTNTIERFKNQDRKTKVGVVLGAVAVVGLAIWAAKSGMSHDGITPDVTPNSGPTNPGDHVSPAEHFTPSARQASRGEGWDQQLTQMGIPKSEQAGVKEQLLNSKDPNLKGWVYRMDDGQPGIARTGKFSQNMLESIKNLRNR